MATYQFVEIGILSAAAAASPGPDLLMVARHSIAQGQRSGVFVAAGLATGLLLQGSLCLVGIAVLLVQTPGALAWLQLLGAMYLLYLGVQTLRSRGSAVLAHLEHNSLASPHFTLWQSYRTGILTNVLNPKAVLFVFSVFTQLVRVGTPQAVQGAYVIEVAAVVLLWFCSIALLITRAPVRRALLRHERHIEGAFAGVLLGFGSLMIINLLAKAFPQ